MKEKERDEILHLAIETFGERSQCDMMIEEASELIKAICKHYRGGAIADVVEEIADVQICLDQMKIIFGDSGAIEHVKLNRLLSRIDEHEGFVKNDKVKLTERYE